MGNVLIGEPGIEGAGAKVARLARDVPTFNVDGQVASDCELANSMSLRLWAHFDPQWQLSCHNFPLLSPIQTWRLGGCGSHCLRSQGVD